VKYLLNHHKVMVQYVCDSAYVEPSIYTMNIQIESVLKIAFIIAL